MSETNAEGLASTEGTTDQRIIDARMPDSVAAVEFVEGFGSTFACPECGSPVSADRCDECGHTPKTMREDPSE